MMKYKDMLYIKKKIKLVHFNIFYLNTILYINLTLPTYFVIFLYDTTTANILGKYIYKIYTYLLKYSLVSTYSLFIFSYKDNFALQRMQTSRPPFSQSRFS